MGGPHGHAETSPILLFIIVGVAGLFFLFFFIFLPQSYFFANPPAI
jgi:hypothetical protein